MKLPTEFYRLPYRFDIKRLSEEATAFEESEWRPHPSGYEGNSALILVSAHGEENDDLQGPMQSTEKLRQCPYISQILAHFNTVIGRSRLMRLAPESDVKEHTDVHYYWHDRVRVHIPIVTDPAIRFWCNGQEVHMAEGEAWIFDNWRPHRVVNPTGLTRIHLVFDTTGSANFWELVRCAETPFEPEHGISIEPQFIPYKPGSRPAFPTERYNVSVVMSPAEVDRLLDELAENLGGTHDSDSIRVRTFQELLLSFRHDWRSLWSVHEQEEIGWPHYRKVIDEILTRASQIPGELNVASNGLSALYILRNWLAAALNPGVTPRQSSTTTMAKSSSMSVSPIGMADPFERPVFIVSAPRSGSTLLFEALANNRNFWTLGGEGHAEIEDIPELNPASQNYHSNRLTAVDATEETAAALRLAYMEKLQTIDGEHYQMLPKAKQPVSLRFLEKTPKNALRIPLLNAIFPDALFIFLHRNPRNNISSIIDAWRSGKFVTYPKLPGWGGAPWSMLLPTGWRELNGAPVEQIASLQWKTTNLQILDDLDELSPDRWCAIRYEDFLSAREAQLRRLCDFAGVPFGERMQATCADELPLSRHTLTPPDPEKWRRNEKELGSVLDKEIQELTAQLNALVV